MKSNVIYTRRLSTTEVKEGFILILKDKVKFFPDSGKPFLLRFGNKEYKTEVTAIDCTCQGPDKPHQHWHMDAQSFIHLLGASKPRVVISRSDKGSYELRELD